MEMFSSRVLAALALLASVAAVPVSDKPSSYPQPITTVTDDEVDDFTSWFRGPWDSLFSSVWKLIPSFADIGPRIVAKDNEFEVIVNAKKYRPEDLSVKIKGDFMFVQGTHEAKHDDSDMVACQFYHTYSLPVNAKAADVFAKLYSDGVLVVTAPLNGTAEEKGPVDRVVPIEETGTPYNKDDKTEKTTEPAPATTTTVAAPPAEEEKKEQTTPSEDATEKDNVIPHGNEVQP